MNRRKDPIALTHWTEEELQKFLEIRQEFFLDPMGSNKDRFVEAAIVLQRALFDWYLSAPGEFEGMVSLVKATATKWSELRKEERRTLPLRRFALNSATAEIPAVESSVPEHQWQKILGSLGLGLSDPGTFDRFLVQLDEETNPSLRINHRYLGELLPHDNMISYLSSITATFLNENAIIGKVSPCVTHMEQAAVKWLLTLVGWDGGIYATEAAETLPVQRLPTLPPPAQRYLRWEREEPTGTIVAGGTVANISALLIARSAVFDYLLGWSGAVQWIGPILAWELIKEIWEYDRLVVLTSKGAHYSVRKAALQAGVAPYNVIEIAGSQNPWVLDGAALGSFLEARAEEDEQREEKTLILAVVATAGKTETGYVDKIDEIVHVIEEPRYRLPTLPKVLAELRGSEGVFETAIKRLLEPRRVMKAFRAACARWDRADQDLEKLLERLDSGNEFAGASHNRLFLHVDAAHGGGFLTVPELRHTVFDGVELADTITIDGHKSFYCYYPCGGLLVRATRWAQAFSIGHSAYISEEQNRGVYREGLMFARAVESGELRQRLTVAATFDRNAKYEEDLGVVMDVKDLDRLDAALQLARRPMTQDRSELTHQPFLQYLEGSRGPQGIMQLYFNLATLGLRGYRSILGWTTLLRTRAEEAVSLGISDLRLVTDEALPLDELMANDKQAALHSTGSRRARFHAFREKNPATVLPVAGGRFLRLSSGACNQLLVTYVPAREAKLIATAPNRYWKEKRGGVVEVRRLMRYLWRVNEHLWGEHIYANPQFTYYLGHTALDLVLPRLEKRNEEHEEARNTRAARQLGALLTEWNAWTKQRDGSNPFLQLLAEYTAEAQQIEKVEEEQATDGEPKNTQDTKRKERLDEYARKFFCHKIIVMHPYTDESLLGDVLRRLAFWGERSVLDVRVADATAQFLFPDAPTAAKAPAVTPSAPSAPEEPT